MSRRSIEVFAPATVANLGPGFDAIGLAVKGLGDRIAATETDTGVRVVSITGDDGKLPLKASDNTASVAAASLLRAVGSRIGMDVQVHKGLPLGSGLGSSAASAAAGAWAAAKLAGLDPSGFHDQLLEAGRLGEEVAAGVGHADNVAPSLFGGVILLRHKAPERGSRDRVPPVELVSIPVPPELTIVVVIPHFSVPTKASRRVLPTKVPLESMVHNSANLAAMVTGFFRDDLELIGRAVSDVIVEPARGSLIAGFNQVKKAALASGALGCSIAGAGPTCFAFTASTASGEEVGAAMAKAWQSCDIDSVVHVSSIDMDGARVVRDTID